MHSVNNHLKFSFYLLSGKPLGSNCNTSLECGNNHSTCYGQKCACLDNFFKQDSLCQPSMSVSESVSVLNF